MTVKLSTGLVEYMAGSGSLRDAFNGQCRISLYGGVEAANADADASGATLLCEITASGDPLEFESDVAGGYIVKDASQTWSGTNLASGKATWYRLELTTDDRSEDPSAIRLQGSIGTVIGDMVMVNPNLVSGNAKTIEIFRMQIPMAS